MGNAATTLSWWNYGKAHFTQTGYDVAFPGGKHADDDAGAYT
jgi:hypothetical protein